MSELGIDGLSPTASPPVLERSPAQVSRLPLWMVAGLVYLVTRVHRYWVGSGINLFEDGLQLLQGRRLAQGDLPYRDFFSLYGPIWSVMGWARTNSWLTEEALGLVVIGGAFYVVLILGRRLSIAWPVLGVVISVQYLLGGFSARLLPAMTVCVLVPVALQRGDRRRAAAAGAVSALGVLYLLDGGVYALGVLAGVPLVGWWMGAVNRRAAVAVWGFGAAGFGVVFGAAVAVFSAGGALSKFIDNAIVFPATKYTSADGFSYIRTVLDDVESSSAPVAAYKFVFFVAIFAIPVTFTAMSAMSLSKRSSRRQLSDSEVLTALALTLLGVAVQRSLLARLDEAKLFDLWGPTLLCGAFTLGHIHRAKLWSGAGRLLLVVAASAPLLLVAQRAVRAESSGQSLVRPRDVVAYDGPLDVPSRLVGVSSEDGLDLRDVEEVVAIIRSQSSSSDEVAAWATIPGLLVLSERRPATAYDFIDRDYTDAATQRIIVAQLRARPPAVVVLSTERWVGRLETVYEYGAIVTDWVEANYRLADSVGRYNVYLPKDG